MRLRFDRPQTICVEGWRRTQLGRAAERRLMHSHAERVNELEREVNFQRTAIRLERLTTLNLAGRAATFCGLAARFFGGRFWFTAAGRRGLAPRPKAYSHRSLGSVSKGRARRVPFTCRKILQNLDTLAFTIVGSECHGPCKPSSTRPSACRTQIERTLPRRTRIHRRL